MKLPETLKNDIASGNNKTSIQTKSNDTFFKKLDESHHEVIKKRLDTLIQLQQEKNDIDKKHNLMLEKAVQDLIEAVEHLKVD